MILYCHQGQRVQNTRLKKSEIEVEPGRIYFNLSIENGTTIRLQSQSGKVCLTGLTMEKI